MSKGFKRSKSSALPDPLPEPPAPTVKEKPKVTRMDRELERTQSQVLVEDTPVKPIKQFTGKRPPPAPLNTTMKTFVTDTPVKSGSAPKTGLRVCVDLNGDEDEDDDEWMIGSPSVRRSLASALTDEDARSGSP